MREVLEAGEKSTILVVDDVPQNLELMKATLAVAGYNVITAADGEEALHKVDDDSPDLVLLDTMMPKLNGYDVCRRLKAEDKTRLIPIVMIATLPELEDKIKGIEAGGDDFLRRPINSLELLARVRSLVRAKHLNDELISVETTLVAMANAIEAKDPYTEGHIERVASYASALGKEIGLSDRDRQSLRKAGILHDVGKIGVRESVLLKAGPLTKEEFDHVKLHPIASERICRPLAQSKSILEVIRHHHERYDGKGYPDGLTGDEIPIGARIMAIADAYDALTSDRPYRERLSEQQALCVLKEEAGKQFDPELALTFVQMVESGALSRELKGALPLFRITTPPEGRPSLV